MRRILDGLGRLPGVRGGIIVAPDGFLIAAALAAGLETEALAALTATLGRELELGAGRLNQGTFDTAVFTAADGTLVLGGSSVGFLAVVATRAADVGLIRVEMKRALQAVQEVWTSVTDATVAGR